VLAASIRRALYETGNELTPTIMQLAGLAMGLLSQAFLGRFVDAAANPQLGNYAGHYATFLLLGMALMDLQNTVVGGLASKIRSAQLNGSLEGLLTTPSPTWLVLLALVVPDVVLAFGRLIVYAIAGRFLFGLDYSAVNPLGVTVVLLVSLLGFAAFALVGAAITMILRRADPLSLLLGAASMIAGGVFYPRSILPVPLRLLGDLLPIAPALDALREAAVHSAGPIALAAPLARLGILVAIVGPLGAWLFSRMLARARIDGSLTAY
jgi:ABC-2 type transport system permease protein